MRYAVGRHEVASQYQYTLAVHIFFSVDEKTHGWAAEYCKTETNENSTKQQRPKNQGKNHLAEIGFNN